MNDLKFCTKNQYIKKQEPQALVLMNVLKISDYKHFRYDQLYPSRVLLALHSRVME